MLCKNNIFKLFVQEFILFLHTKDSEEFCKKLCKKHNFKKEEFEEYFKIVQEKFNEIPSDQEIASQECKQSQIKNQVIETLEKVILDIKTLK